MASDSIAALRAQLEADLEVLNPQIRGVEDLIKTSISNELMESLQEPPLAAMYTRRSDIQTTLAALATLEANGWPEPFNFGLPPSLLSELEGQTSDLKAGATLFAPAPLATHFVVAEEIMPASAEPS